MAAPRMGLPHSFAWVRAPAYDTRFAEAWELPNGEFYFVAKGKSFCVVQIDGHAPVAKIMTTKESKRG